MNRETDETYSDEVWDLVAKLEADHPYLAVEDERHYATSAQRIVNDLKAIGYHLVAPHPDLTRGEIEHAIEFGQRDGAGPRGWTPTETLGTVLLVAAIVVVLIVTFALAAAKG